MAEHGCGALTCGEFTALQLEPDEYEITCRQLPDWSFMVAGGRAVASDLIIRLQAEYRGSWAAEESMR